MTAPSIEAYAASVGAEIVDLRWGTPAPARTTTACNALRCGCVEYADGPVIAGYRTCHVCGHSHQIHQPRKQPKPTRRGN